MSEMKALAAGRPIASRNRLRAQALVEAALMFPILVLLLIGVVDYGRVVYHQIVLANAAREGARIASNPSASDSTVRSATIAAALPVVISDSNITINPSGSRASSSGQTVTVTVSYNMSIITPGITEILAAIQVGGAIPLSQSAQMVIF